MDDDFVAFVRVDRKRAEGKVLECYVRILFCKCGSAPLRIPARIEWKNDGIDARKIGWGSSETTALIKDGTEFQIRSAACGGRFDDTAYENVGIFFGGIGIAERLPVLPPEAVEVQLKLYAGFPTQLCVFYASVEFGEGVSSVRGVKIGFQFFGALAKTVA